MAKVPKGTTVYTRGPIYKEGQEAPDEPEKEPDEPEKKPKTKEPKKGK